MHEVTDAPHITNPLTVAVGKKGKLRLVLDGRHVNPNLFKYKCCYEDQSVARQMFSKGDYLFSFDIRGAYHHIMIYPEHQTYLGFAWLVGDCLKYYVFCVLPFGISTAGYIFTKLMRTVVKTWRASGFKIIVFLDDGLGGDQPYEKALNASHFMRNDLIKFGFLIANEKCNWLPSLGVFMVGFRLEYKTWHFIYCNT